jgi:hypothetical protein
MSEMKQCPYCGEDILQAAIKCKHCGSRLKKKSVTFVQGLVVIIGGVIVVAMCSHSDNPRIASTPVVSAPATAEPGASTPPPAMPMPADESAFIQAVSSAQSESTTAANDMQRGGIKAKRDHALCGLLSPSLAASNWIGTFKTISSNSDGKGVLGIEIAKDIVVRTWGNSFSDSEYNTLIEPGSEVFTTVSALSVGQPVVFSGHFFKDEDACIRETSMTLRGHISEPEFLFFFSSALSPHDVQTNTSEAPRPEANSASIETPPSGMSCNAPPYGANPGKYQALHDAFVNASKSQPTPLPGLMLAQMKVTLETACQAKFLKGDRTMFHRAGLSDETIDSMDVAILTNAWFASRNAAMAKEESLRDSRQQATAPTDNSDSAATIPPQSHPKRVQVASIAVAPPVEDAPSLPDDLTPVRVVDAQAADRIAAYCTTTAAKGATNRHDAIEATCRHQEADAWRRLVVQKEFPSITTAVIQMCSQPPFPDSYVAKEACAKYELHK